LEKLGKGLVKAWQEFSLKIKILIKKLKNKNKNENLEKKNF